MFLFLFHFTIFFFFHDRPRIVNINSKMSSLRRFFISLFCFTIDIFFVSLVRTTLFKIHLFVNIKNLVFVNFFAREIQLRQDVNIYKFLYKIERAQF